MDIGVENMRVKNSSYNVFFNILQLLITTILTFVTRTFFIKYLGKENAPIDNIKYADFMNMFQDMTEVMQHTYARYPSITLVPIDDFLSVRSWLVCGKHKGNQAIMAFPSRYSSSEIGFYTTDESTKDYIKTMQRGILINYVKE